MPTRIPTAPGALPTRPLRPPTTFGGFKVPQPIIELASRYGRKPKASDLIIKQGFDGKTPDQAVALVRGNLSGPLAAQNTALVESTAKERYRDVNVALNNLFTLNTPNRQWADSLGLQQVTVLGTLSSSQPVVYKASLPGSSEPKYFTRDWSGRFVALSKPPALVVMEAAVRLSPPGINQTYPKWSLPALAGPLTTITEL